MDGGRVIPPRESERPTKIIPPLPTKPAGDVDTAVRVPLKERFAKAFAVGAGTAGHSAAANGAPANGAPANGTTNGKASNGAAKNGAANGTTNGVAAVAAVAATQPIARVSAAVAAPPAPPATVAPAPVKSAKSRVKPAKVVPVVAPAARAQPQVAPAPSTGGKQTRRARLRLTRVDPWSVMKTSFLLSVAFGIVTVSSVLIVWSVLGSAGVWDSVNETVKGVVGDTGSNFNIEDYIGMDRVLGFTALVAVIDVVLLTAIATLSAFLYNMAAALLGGLEVTLVEDN